MSFVDYGIRFVAVCNSLFQIGEVSRQLASGVAPARLTELISMAKKVSAKGRALARKQRDKWKLKRWYTIRAPRHPWDFKNIGETLGESDESIVGRVYEMTFGIIKDNPFDWNFVFLNNAAFSFAIGGFSFCIFLHF